MKARSVHTNEPHPDAHLRSPDFFDVEQHPELTFRSTRVEPVDEDTFRIVGEEVKLVLDVSAVNEAGDHAFHAPRTAAPLAV